MKILFYFSFALFTIGAYSVAFGAATSTSFIIENDQLVTGGGRQSSDSFTNIASVDGALISARATSTSFSADFGMAFWNAAHPGTLSVTDASNNADDTATFTLSYASADPESPLFMICYGAVQADVESSCTGTATRAFTSAFSYSFSGLLSNTPYYFRVYPLSGYDNAGNPVLSNYYSDTVSASRARGTVFLSVSGGSGSGGAGTVAGGSGGAVASMSEPSPAPTGIIGRMLLFFGFSSPPTAIAPVAEKSVSAPSRLLSTGYAPPPASEDFSNSEDFPDSKDFSNSKDFSVPIFPVISPALLPVRGVVLDSATNSGISAARVTVYICPSPAARLAGCSVWKNRINPLMADLRGQFIFAVPAGIYRLHAEARGYEKGESDSVVVTKAGSSVSIPLRKKSILRRLFGW